MVLAVMIYYIEIQVMLAILIGLLTILTWHFTKSYTAQSLDSLAYGLRHELLQRPILRMWGVLNSTAEITTAQVKLSEYVMKKYSKPANQAEQVEVFAYPLCDLVFILLALNSCFKCLSFYVVVRINEGRYVGNVCKSKSS